MTNKTIRIIIAVVLAVLLVVVLRLSLKPTVEERSGPRIVMGTFARVIAVAADSKTAENCIKAAFEQLTTVENLMSAYKEDSELTRINNQAHLAPVKISAPTFDVLQKSVQFSSLTDGAFDITVGPLVQLWRAAQEANSPPSDWQLRQARAKVGYDKLILDADKLTVRFTVEGMRLDLGGIAKGWAIDRAIKNMQEKGARGGMVDVGGDIRCFGLPPKGKKHWLIGLQDPHEAKDALTVGKPLLVLKLNDAAVATSGGYRRFALIEGKKYSHIIDRKTGSAADSLSSASIITDSATRADALATAVTVLGPQKGLQLIEKLPKTEAILISPPPKYKLTKTTGANIYITRTHR